MFFRILLVFSLLFPLKSLCLFFFFFFFFFIYFSSQCLLGPLSFGEQLYEKLKALFSPDSQKKISPSSSSSFYSSSIPRKAKSESLSHTKRKKRAIFLIFFSFLWRFLHNRRPPTQAPHHTKREILPVLFRFIQKNSTRVKTYSEHPFTKRRPKNTQDEKKMHKKTSYGHQTAFPIVI